MGVLAEHNKTIRCVRSAFMEGKPIYPDSALYDRAHIQIAVRDTILIEKVWRVEPEGESDDSKP